MKAILFIFLLAFVIACNSTPAVNEGTEDEATEGSVHAGAADTIVTSAKPLVLTGCYEMTLKKDTGFLNLQVTDTVVNGELVFDFFEKDKNTGTLKGVLRNNLIVADYTFQSEGVTSVREVIFQIKDSVLVQATGNLAEQNGKLVFADKANLQYQVTNPFIKVPCPAR